MIRRDAKTPEMAITEGELTSMTAELDMLHNETFPAVRKTLDEFSANVAHLARRDSTARRTFLYGLGGAAVLGTVAACSSSGGTSSPTSGSSMAASTSGSMSASPSGTGAASVYKGDLRIVALAAALENLAVVAYKGALTMAGQGKLGTVPPAIATFVTTVMAQHADHAQAWNAVLTKGGLPAVTDTPLTIAPGQVAMLKAARSVPDVAKLALGLENAAADTYTFAAANVSDSDGIMTAATIQPVETMHAAILSFVLGQYPVPLTFIGTDKAAKPDVFTR